MRQEIKFTMGRVGWCLLSRPLPPTPTSLYLTTAKSQYSPPVVTQRSATQQCLWKIALPLIMKVALCMPGSVPHAPTTSVTMLMSGLLHMHKNLEGIFQHFALGDLEFLDLPTSFFFKFPTTVTNSPRWATILSCKGGYSGLCHTNSQSTLN